MKPTDYLDLAIEKQGLKSDRELCRALELKSNTIATGIRRGVYLPSDDTMIKLAELAGEDPDIALLRLNVWRAKTDAARAHYRSIEQRIVKYASVLFLTLIIAVMLNSGNAQANNSRTDDHHYYGVYKLCDNLITCH